jgi:hypothetical protein
VEGFRGSEVQGSGFRGSGVQGSELRVLGFWGRIKEGERLGRWVGEIKPERI